MQHTAFWAVMVLMYTINYVFAPGVQQRRFVDTLIFLPGHIFFAYTQMYFAIPLYLLQKKYNQYVGYSLLFLMISVFYGHWAQANLISPFRNYAHLKISNNYKFFIVRIGRSAFALLFTCGLAVAIKLFKEWFRQRERTLKVENEKVKIELESLRSQIHPHFLFNTLNNLYSLTLTSSASASLVVVHLSDLLRYMLYECKEPVVTVEKELQMLKKYIELEKLRYGDRLEVAFILSGDTSKLEVSPLLLLPFVENSFKHGVSEQLDQCWININVHVADGKFTFQVSNSRLISNRNNYGGLGMDNVIRRLNILYPQTHTLKIHEEDEVYVVKLELLLTSSNAQQTSPITTGMIEPTQAVNA